MTETRWASCLRILLLNYFETRYSILKYREKEKERSISQSRIRSLQMEEACLYLTRPVPQSSASQGISWGVERERGRGNLYHPRIYIVLITGTGACKILTRLSVNQDAIRTKSSPLCRQYVQTILHGGVLALATWWVLLLNVTNKIIIKKKKWIKN